MTGRFSCRRKTGSSSQNPKPPDPEKILIKRKSEHVFYTIFNMKRFACSAAVLVWFAAGCSLPLGKGIPSILPTEFDCREPGTVRPVTVNSETIITLYLPPCYAEDADRRYPVLYLLPGFGGTDHVFFGDGADRIADELILGGKIPPFLIAGTENFFPDIDAAALTEAVLPFVESNFRTLPDRRFRAAAGGSYGGSVAYHLAFKRYDLIGTAGIFGNGVAFGEEGMIRFWLAEIPEGMKPRIFLNVGEGDAYMLERDKALIPLLDEAGIAHMEIFGPGGHSGDYWLSNFAAYFRWLAVDWS
jgi:enterochelin esterase-like enzyme